MGEGKDTDDPFEYEVRLRQDGDLALREIGNFFEGKAAVNRTLDDLCRRLEEHAIPYALMGALALGRHGFVRATTDIDLLMTPAGLERFKEVMVGRGYVAAFSGAKKTFRATDTGVRVEMLLTGEYPGDGKPKPVVFPDPEIAHVLIERLRVVPLGKFIELKLASGMTAPHRGRDLVDIQDLIRSVKLPLALGEQLDESVRIGYRKVWQLAQVKDPHQEEEGG